MTFNRFAGLGILDGVGCWPETPFSLAYRLAATDVRDESGQRSIVPRTLVLSRLLTQPAVILRAVLAMGSERLSKGSNSPRSTDKGLRFMPFWTAQCSNPAKQL